MPADVKRLRLPAQIQRPRDGDISAYQPDDRGAGCIIFESHFLAGGYLDACVFEDHGPFLRIIDAFSSLGGIVLIPGAGGGQGEVDHRVLGDVEGSVGAIGPGDDDVRLQCALAGEEGEGDNKFSVFHDGHF